MDEQIRKFGMTEDVRKEFAKNWFTGPLVLVSCRLADGDSFQEWVGSNFIQQYLMNCSDDPAIVAATVSYFDIPALDQSM